MGNRAVMAVGTVIAIIGFVMAIIGTILENHEEQERTWYGYVTTKPYEDVGGQVFLLGVVFLVLGVIVSIAGVFAHPSRRETIRAQRAMEKDRARQLPDTDNSHIEFEPILAKPNGLHDRVPKKHCRFCGQMIPMDSSFCEHCGSRL